MLSLLGVGDSGEELRPEKLVVGLGNPGAQYAFTRHNIGFMAVDCLAGKKGVSFSDSQCESVAGFARIGGESAGNVLALAKPVTYMNDSGMAVKAMMRKWDIGAEGVLVVVDDFELPLGSLRLRASGSHGGHNGLRSVCDLLGTDSFARLRVGVDSPLRQDAGSVIDFVLGEFAPEEEEYVKEAVFLAADLVEDWAVRGLEYCQSKYNRRAEMPPIGNREESS